MGGLADKLRRGGARRHDLEQIENDHIIDIGTEHFRGPVWHDVFVAVKSIELIDADQGLELPDPGAAT